MGQDTYVVVLGQGHAGSGSDPCYFGGNGYPLVSSCAIGVASSFNTLDGKDQTAVTMNDDDVLVLANLERVA